MTARLASVLIAFFLSAQAYSLWHQTEFDSDHAHEDDSNCLACIYIHNTDDDVVIAGASLKVDAGQWQVPTSRSAEAPRFSPRLSPPVRAPPICA